jgi:hypothetical protein
MNTQNSFGKQTPIGCAEKEKMRFWAEIRIPVFPSKSTAAQSPIGRFSPQLVGTGDAVKI